MIASETSNAARHQADIVACRKILSNGSRTFHAASYLLPRRIREPASALYAFCRIADDIVDLRPDPADGLNELKLRLDRIYSGSPIDHPADRALSQTVRDFDLPATLLEALLEGFQWDAERRQYADLAALKAYGARVAGTVGVMMAVLMDRRHADELARAADLGVAMQLTNIARDVGEDARAGRLYLPHDWLIARGVDPARWLANPVFSPEIAAVVQQLIEAADELYVRSGSGIARLPADCRPGIYAARYLYAGIGHELIRNGLNSVEHRAVVPRHRKITLLARAIAATPLSRRGKTAAALAEGAFLVAAAERASDGLNWRETPWWDVHGKALLLLDILERIEQRESEARAARLSTLGNGRLNFGLEVQS